MYDLDNALIETNGNAWTVRNACEGVQIFGGIGSGKTSGSGRFLALKYLRAGYGGLVLTAKSDECDLWQSYCRETNRENDLVILRPDGHHSFNFLDYEANRSGKGAGLVENIVVILKTVIKAKDNQSSSSDPFWEDALDMLLFNIIDLCHLAYGRLDIDDLYRVAQSIPKDRKLRTDENFRTKKAFGQAYFTLRDKLERNANLYSDAQIRTIHRLDEYFWETFIHLNERTRSIIEHSFWGFLFRISRDPIYSLLCSKKPSFDPDDSIRGKIILLDLPVKMYDKVGRDAQILFKYIWQRAMERRDVRSDGGKPVFLWADEAQNFLHEHDIDYQATARSSRVCTVYLSQNLPNYHAHLSGQSGEARVKSFLGTLGTKMFHANADYDTNKYASELIGQEWVEDISSNRQVSGNMSMGESQSYKLEYPLRPEDFTQLMTGGPSNNFDVQAIVHRQGTPWDNQQKRNFKKLIFNQNHHL